MHSPFGLGNSDDDEHEEDNGGVSDFTKIAKWKSFP